MRNVLIQSLSNTLVPALARAIEANGASLGMLRRLATEDGQKELKEHLLALERHWRDLQPRAPRRTLTVKQADAAWGALKETLVDLGVPSNGDALHPRNLDDPHGFRRHMLNYWTGISRRDHGYAVSGAGIDKVFPCLPADANAFTGHYAGIRRASDGREDLAMMGIVQLRIEEALEELAADERR